MADIPGLTKDDLKVFYLCGNLVFLTVLLIISKFL